MLQQWLQKVAFDISNCATFAKSRIADPRYSDHHDGNAKSLRFTFEHLLSKLFAAKIRTPGKGASDLEF